jgi:hypothetical protein
VAGRPVLQHLLPLHVAQRLAARHAALVKQADTSTARMPPAPNRRLAVHTHAHTRTPAQLRLARSVAAVAPKCQLSSTQGVRHRGRPIVINGRACAHRRRKRPSSFACVWLGPADTAQRNTTQHNTTQHNTTQRNTRVSRTAADPAALALLERAAAAHVRAARRMGCGRGFGRESQRYRRRYCPEWPNRRRAITLCGRCALLAEPHAHKAAAIPSIGLADAHPVRTGAGGPSDTGSGSGPGGRGLGVLRRADRQTDRWTDRRMGVPDGLCCCRVGDGALPVVADHFLRHGVSPSWPHPHRDWAHPFNGNICLSTGPCHHCPLGSARLASRGEAFRFCLAHCERSAQALPRTPRRSTRGAHATLRSSRTHSVASRERPRSEAGRAQPRPLMAQIQG